ncbi:cation:proton antiporter [Alloscardovia venturai]|uniref:Cation:proton antiporter n=1 Tax=Alloscardovia venturai TaxID=1769421 RepID=A0ABW2Y4Z8_9BIFI
MTQTFISLTVIAAIAAVVPLIARLIPKQFVPETVLLIAAGALLGPHMFGIIRSSSESIIVLSDLGCAFLFLLAGYEISPRSLTSKDGRRGLITWGFTLVLGIAVAFILPQIASGSQGKIATGLLLTTTALGTLMPILKDNGLLGTRVGDLILAYGTWGELATVIAVAILLSTRQAWATAVILLAMLLLCIWIAVVGGRAIQTGNRIYRFIEERAESNSQTMFRITMLILILLVAFSSIFDIDIVLGAFAAGFILRFLTKQENESLMTKLEGTAYGFFIPLFFIVSGSGINLKAVIRNPGLLIIFIVALVVVRAVPIIVSLSIEKDPDKRLTWHNRLSVAFYSTTALPLIVAITGIATNHKIISTDTASVLVAAGAVTVFLMPLIGQITYKVVDAEPIKAISEIAHSPNDIRTIMHEHLIKERERAAMYREIAKKRIIRRLDAIEDPQERDEMRKLIKKQTQENAAFLESQRLEGYTIRLKHRAEFRHLYHKYHDGDVPDMRDYFFGEDDAQDESLSPHVA